MLDKKQTQIQALPEDLKGKYCNSINVMWNKEEFCFDFISLVQNQAQLISRIFITPGHMKRIARVLFQNLEEYEKRNGEIKEPKDVLVKLDQ